MKHPTETSNAGIRSSGPVYLQCNAFASWPRQRATRSKSLNKIKYDEVGLCFWVYARCKYNSRSVRRHFPIKNPVPYWWSSLTRTHTRTKAASHRAVVDQRFIRSDKWPAEILLSNYCSICGNKPAPSPRYDPAIYLTGDQNRFGHVRISTLPSSWHSG